MSHTTSAILRCLALSLLLALTMGSAHGQARLRDIADIQGVRTNPISGIGLVTGLNGTGDGVSLTRQMAANLLKRNGLNVPEATISPANMAAVLVSAQIPPFAQPGSKIDITVSSLGDSSSLRGGQLATCLLTGFDNKTVYAIASGPLSNGSISAKAGTGSSQVINHPTVASVPGGAHIEKAVPQKMVGKNSTITWLLRDTSYATARNTVAAISKKWPGIAAAVDARAVRVRIPKEFRKDPVPFIASMGELEVKVKPRSVVVISERYGTIIAGGDVVILPGSITHSNLSISVRESPRVSQPNPLSDGQTVVVPESEISITESGTPMVPIEGSIGAGEVAAALNKLGVSPGDLITIFRMLKTAGLLQAELVTK